MFLKNSLNFKEYRYRSDQYSEVEMYEIGVMVAAAISVITIIKNIFKVFSTEANNYETIGKKMSVLTGQFEDVEAGKSFKILRVLSFFFVLFVTIATWALSWVSVGFSVLIWSFLLLDLLSLPEFVKESRWRIKNIRLSKKQMLSEILKLNENYSEENLEIALRYVDERLSDLSESKAS